MKLQPDRFDTLFINAYAADWIAVSGEKKHHSVVVSSQGQCSDWSCRSFAELSQDHFDRLDADRPEVVIFGSGAKLRFVSPRAAARPDRTRHRRRDHGHRRCLPHLQHPGPGRPARGRRPAARIGLKQSRALTPGEVSASG